MTVENGLGGWRLAASREAQRQGQRKRRAQVLEFITYVFVSHDCC